MGNAPVGVDELDLLLVAAADQGILGTLLAGVDMSGLTIRQVRGMEDATDAYLRRPPDVVVLFDPDGASLDQGAVYRLLAKNPRPCVVLVSDNEEAGEAALRAGISDLVPTSAVAPSTLHRVVRRAVERHAAAERRAAPKTPPTRGHAGGAQRLRGPLSVVIDNLRELRGTGNDEQVETALRACYALGGEIDQLLAAQRRSESGDRAAVDLAELVEDVCADLEALAVAVGARIAVAPMPVIWGRREPLRLLIRQVIVNALEHGGAHVAVKISAELRRRGIRLYVDDDGPGVPPELRSSAFSPHPRDVVEQRNGGYGLPAVAAVAAAHGGRAWIEDSPFGGTRVVVELPVRRGRDGGDRGTSAA